MLQKTIFLFVAIFATKNCFVVESLRNSLTFLAEKKVCKNWTTYISTSHFNLHFTLRLIFVCWNFVNSRLLLSLKIVFCSLHIFHIFPTSQGSQTFSPVTSFARYLQSETNFGENLSWKILTKYWESCQIRFVVFSLI